MNIFYFREPVFMRIFSGPISTIYSIIHVNSLSSMKLLKLTFFHSKVASNLSKTNNTSHSDVKPEEKLDVWPYNYSYSAIETSNKLLLHVFFVYSTHCSTWILIKSAIYIIIYDQLNRIDRQSLNTQRTHNNNQIQLQLIKSHGWNVIHASLGLESSAVVDKWIYAWNLWTCQNVIVKLYDILTSLKIQWTFLRIIAWNMVVHVFTDNVYSQLEFRESNWRFKEFWCTCLDWIVVEQHVSILCLHLNYLIESLKQKPTNWIKKCALLCSGMQSNEQRSAKC